MNLAASILLNPKFLFFLCECLISMNLHPSNYFVFLVGNSTIWNWRQVKEKTREWRAETRDARPCSMGWKYFWKSTGKSLSEAPIFASTNPKYEDRSFIELSVQYMKIASSKHFVYTNCFLFWHSEQFMFWACNFYVLDL